MKSICIISFSPLHRDPRVKRQVQTLKGKYKITCAGFTDIDESNVEFWPVKLLTRNKYKKLKAAIFLITRQFSKYYRQRREVESLYNIWQKNHCQKFDLVIANDIEALIVALDIAGECPVFLDAHEYSPRQSNNFVWRLFRAPFVDWQCRTYLNRAASVSSLI